MPKESGEGRESALQRGWTVESRSDVNDQPDPATVSAPVEAQEAEAQNAVAQETEAQETAAEGIEPATNELAESGQTAQLSNLTVVMLGLTGGIYMLYAWVWLSWAQFYAEGNAAAVEGSGSIGGFLQQIVFWIAPLAPILWFVSALIMHRRQPRKLALALILGCIVLLPLPMIFGNGAAQ